MLSRSWVHPFLISAFPVFAFYAFNQGQTELPTMLRPALAALVLAGLALGVARLVFRGTRRAAVVASLALAAFWSYGQIYDALKLIGLSGDTVVRHRYLLPVLIGALGLAIWQVVRSGSIGKWTGLLNVVALALWLQPLVQVAAFEAGRVQQSRSLEAVQPDCVLSPQPDSRTPDVYLIVMDAYERDDVLREMHGYDNTPFIRGLEDRGFFVARGSLSNYRHTEMSLASVLNFDYLQNIPGSYDPANDEHPGLGPLIVNSRLRRELECLGYYSVSIESGVYWSEWRDARYFFAREGGALERLQLRGGLTRTETFLINTTVLRAAIDLGSQLSGPSGVFTEPLADHRDRILFAFEQLRSIPNLPGRKLVFAHIISPHPPIVFGPDGEFVTMATFETDPSAESDVSPLLQAYADQVEYLNTELLDSVDAILARSEVPPVIIIQGDHGWAERNDEDKLSILNALHLPSDGQSRLHQRTTPVNSFRHVLNLYFGGQFDLLEDVSYFSSEDAPYDFRVIPNSWTPDG